MSKAKIIIDMPKNCIKCRFCDMLFCLVTTKCIDDDDLETRPEWCPLIEIPEKDGD